MNAITFVITLLPPTHTSTPVPNSSKSVSQYNIHTISTLYLFFDVSTQ